MRIPSFLQHSVTRFVLVGVTLFLFGAMAEQVWQRSLQQSVGSFDLRPDTRPSVCTVEVDGIRNGSISGHITGSGRVFIGAEQAFPDGSGAFVLRAGDFLTNRVMVIVPEGMRYVASRRGTRYYPLSSSQAKTLAPDNRVYFRTSEEAEAARYRPGV